MISAVAKIVHKHIEEAMSLIIDQGQQVRESSLIFKEQNYGKRTFSVETPTHGLGSISTAFAFQTKVEKIKLPKRKDVVDYIQTIMESMRFSSEVGLLALVFTERLMQIGEV